MPRLSKRTLAQYLTKLRHQKPVDDGGAACVSLRLSNRIKLLRDVLGVCSKVDTLHDSQSGKREGRAQYKVVVSTFVVNGNYGRWGIGTVPLVTTAPRPRKFFGMGFSTDPIPCFSRE